MLRTHPCPGVKPESVELGLDMGCSCSCLKHRAPAAPPRCCPLSGGQTWKRSASTDQQYRGVSSKRQRNEDVWDLQKSSLLWLWRLAPAQSSALTGSLSTNPEHVPKCRAALPSNAGTWPAAGRHTLCLAGRTKGESKLYENIAKSAVI